MLDTLNTLEIEEWQGNMFTAFFHWKNNNQSYLQDPTQLGQLTSLWNLKIISSAVDAYGSFERKLRAICQLLSIAKVLSPVQIQSLIIQFNVQVAPETNFLYADSSPILTCFLWAIAVHGNTGLFSFMLLEYTFTINKTIFKSVLGTYSN